MKKLFLIDGMSIAFRAFHAMSETKLTNKNGEPTAAIYSFVNIITSFLEKENPENIAVAFDCRQPTFRHKLFKQYKANRKEFPEELGLQLPYMKKFLEFAGIICIEKAGFEADDVIGTLSRNASENAVNVYCLTSDKDFFQLLNDNVFVLRNKRNSAEFELIDKNNVKEKFGVESHQIIDYLSLIGDTSDNVPGVKGIGEKTAIPLIERFGDIETIYEKIDEIEKERTKKLLLDSKDLAFLSKELVTIKTDVELDFAYDLLVKNEPNYAELDELFKHLDFKYLREKWKKKDFNDNFDEKKENFNNLNHSNYNSNENNEIHFKNLENIRTVKHKYITVDAKNCSEMLADIANESFLSLCVETDFAARDSSKIVGISLCNSPEKAYYLPLNSLNNELKDENKLFSEQDFSFKSELFSEYILNDLRAILEDEKIAKFGHNIKQAAYILKRNGINLSPIVFDTTVAAYLIDSSNSLNFKDLAEKYLLYSSINLTEFTKNKKAEFCNLEELSLPQKRDYFCEIAHQTCRLKDVLTEKLNENNLFYVANYIEFPLIEVLINMEFDGISIDKKKLYEIGLELGKEIDKLKKNIYEETNEEFNIDSPKQLADVLFNRMGLRTVKKNKTGFSTDLQTLQELAQIHPIADLILNYRKFAKIKNTYIDALPKLVNTVTNRIHTTFNQTTVTTGRLSSTEPNLQNIPIRTELGKEIREVFIAKSNDICLLSADYSQIELRIMAFLSNDSNLIDAFKNNIDVHSATASLLFNCKLEKVTEDMRRTAKTVNFGIIYGLGSFGLSQRLHITRNAASSIIQGYFESFPGIKTYISDAINKVRELGYAETVSGRKRFFPDINHKNHNIRAAAERAAINMPIQGTASDMIKIAMLNIHKILKQQNLQSKMILQVHDELLFEVKLDEIDFIKATVNVQMQNSISLGEIPLLISIGTGKNWLSAHSL